MSESLSPQAVVVACRARRQALARELAEISPREVTAHEIARLGMMRLEHIQSAAEQGEAFLTEEQKRLLGLDTTDQSRPLGS